MRQIIALISTAVLACNTHAAIITTNVTGVLGDWFTKSWDAGTSQVLYQHFLSSNPDILVQGSISYDDNTEEMTALSLSQVGTLTTTTVDADTITISGLSWSLDGNTIDLDQLSGTATCSNNFSRCSAMATAISGNGSNSPFQFDGVKKGFKVGSVGQAAQYGGYA
jgi:hypothetical protein